MKRLKLTQRNYTTHTGVVGRYEFVDGISVELIPQNERIRIGANFGCVEIEEDGTDGVDPSPAASVVNGRKERAMIVPLGRQTEEEKASENVQVMLGGEKPRDLYSMAALEAVADAGGISAVRELAQVWNVRSKSIRELMDMIANAQTVYVRERTDDLLKSGANAEDIALVLAYKNAAVKAEKPVVEKMVRVVVVETPVVPEDTVADAAKTGDFAAALNAG